MTGMQDNPAPARPLRQILLLVDDDPDVLMMTAALLNDFGYEVVCAETAEQALELLAGSMDCDAVITDHMLPGISGISLLRGAATMRPGLPGLLVTGYGGDADTD